MSTREENEAQRRSFVFGNLSIENPNMTHEVVNEAAETLALERDFDADEPSNPQLGPEDDDREATEEIGR